MSTQEESLILYCNVGKLMRCKGMLVIHHIMEEYQDVISVIKKILIVMISSITVPSVSMTFAKLAPLALIES